MVMKRDKKSGSKPAGTTDDPPASIHPQIPEPPPFQPDPALITYIERGRRDREKTGGYRRTGDVARD